MMISSEAARLAVVHRDPAFDRVFVYGVVTTSIFCRPSCPSRPKPDNIRFFADGAAATRQGFRQCRRCRPDE